MKVQVTSTQFIETDDIVFAKQARDNASQTLVWLRYSDTPFVVSVDYDQFVDRLNQAHLGYNHQFIHTS